MYADYTVALLLRSLDSTLGAPCVHASPLSTACISPLALHAPLHIPYVRRLALLYDVVLAAHSQAYIGLLQAHDAHRTSPMYSYVRFYRYFGLNSTRDSCKSYVGGRK